MEGLVLAASLADYGQFQNVSKTQSQGIVSARRYRYHAVPHFPMILENVKHTVLFLRFRQFEASKTLSRIGDNDLLHTSIHL
jgi:hypothetical protein